MARPRFVAIEERVPSVVTKGNTLGGSVDRSASPSRAAASVLDPRREFAPAASLSLAETLLTRGILGQAQDLALSAMRGSWEGREPSDPQLALRAQDVIIQCQARRDTWTALSTADRALRVSASYGAAGITQRLLLRKLQLLSNLGLFGEALSLVSLHAPFAGADRETQAGLALAKGWLWCVQQRPSRARVEALFASGFDPCGSQALTTDLLALRAWAAFVDGDEGEAKRGLARLGVSAQHIDDPFVAARLFGAAVHLARRIAPIDRVRAYERAMRKRWQTDARGSGSAAVLRGPWSHIVVWGEGGRSLESWEMADTVRQRSESLRGAPSGQPGWRLGSWRPLASATL